MQKFIAGLLSITLLIPMVIFSEGNASANSNLIESPSKTIAAINETSIETVTGPSTDFSYSYHDRPRYIDADFQEFIEEVYTGYSEIISGVYIDEDFALSVVQQPASQPGFISVEEETITEFGLAQDYGSIGLLAHNYLAGKKFFQLGIGETIYLVYGDGDVERYTIVDIDTYQALSPNSPNSQFVNLEGDKEKLSAADLFYRIYDQDDALILQTCIEKDGNESWGRWFIIAVPGEYPADIPMGF
ncbi:MAG: hypothetical protein P8046_13175 [Anaerolineales bacterium]